MTTDSPAGRGRWHQGKTDSGRSPGQSRTGKWIAAMVLSSLLAAVVGFLGWMAYRIFFPSHTRSLYVPLRVTSYKGEQIAPILGMASEQKALADAKVFSLIESVEDANREPTLGVIRTRLNNLRNVQPGASVVAYLSAYAMVNGAGEIQILANDSDPFNLKTMLPLRAVLDAMRQCPSRTKLLVLDIMKLSTYPFDLGGTPDGVADLLPLELKANQDPSKTDTSGLIVLAACSPGESGLWSETLGQSVFGHFFSGAFFDRQADVNQNGTLSVSELEKYLKTKVDGWARRFRGVSQRPTLSGVAPDFELGEMALEPARAPQKIVANDTVEAEKGASKEKPAPSPVEKSVGDAGKAKEKAQEARDPSLPDAPAYPEWLRKGWELRQAWWGGKSAQDFTGASAPRVYRRLEANLLRTERGWRGGEDGGELETALKRAVTPLQVAMERARAVPKPPVRSVGQAKVQGWTPDAGLVAKLKALLEDRRKAPRPTEPDAQATRKKALGELSAAWKAKPNPALELAGTVMDAAADERLDADTVQFLGSLVKESGVSLDVIELRLLVDLASRAAAAARDWSEETAKLAWNTIRLAEETSHHPGAFAWVRGLLETADRKRHEAQVLLLADSRGFVSWDQIRTAWEEARKDLEFVAETQSAIEDARVNLDRARAVLPAHLPFLQATRRPGLHDIWLAVATAAVAVDRQLNMPLGKDGEAARGSSRTQLETYRNELAAALRDLRSTLTQLQQPFTAESIRELVALAQAPQPNPRTAAEIDAMLATPFPAPEDRALLWTAGRVLDQRLESLPSTAETAPDGAADPARVEQARAEAARRARRLAALLSLTGQDATARNLDAAVELNNEVTTLSRRSGADAASDSAALMNTWSGLARVARLVHAKLIQMLEQGDREGDRPGWLAPAYVLSLDANPTFPARELEILRHGDWLAARYRHTDRDLHETAEPSQFYETLAAEVPHSSAGLADPMLKLGLASSAPPSLSAQKPTSKTSVQLALAAFESDAPGKIKIAVRAPDDQRLQIAPPVPDDLDLTPQKPVTTSLDLNWSEERGKADLPPPPGFILEATLNDQRCFHLRIPVSVDSNRTLPRLVLSTTKGDPTEVPFDSFRLRTLPGRQAFHLFVRNPAPQPREVVVEILDGDKLLASSGPKPLPLPGNATIPVAALVSAPETAAGAPKENEPLAEAPANLRLGLREASSTVPGSLDRQPIHPEIAMPDEYMEVVQAQFVPPRQGQPNQIQIVLRALPGMTGPPGHVQLVLPADPSLFPTLRDKPEGRLSGDVEPGKNLTLTAMSLKLNLDSKDTGVFQLDLDGVRRALWFRTRFAEDGGIQRAEEERVPPRIRFRTERIVKPGQPALLRVMFEADKLPPQASLSFSIESLVDGKVVVDHSFPDRPAKRRHIGFAHGAEAGTLLFQASVEDWAETFNVQGTRGARQARAVLRDASRRVLDQHVSEIILDDQPPEIRAIDTPSEVEAGSAPIEVRCLTVAPPSGIDDVALAAGAKVLEGEEFAKANAEGKTIKARRAAPGDPRVWVARVPVPKDADGKLVITARATSGVGLTALFGQEVPLRAKPMPSPAEAAAKDAKPAPGAIEGLVVEGPSTQPGLLVYLIDPKAKDPDKAVVKDTTTDNDGKFALPDIPPGEYVLFCQKDTSKRLARQPVSVEAGKVRKARLELLLP